MNKYVVGILITAAAVGSALFFFKEVEHQHFGTVIVLNGPSGSGKSSIQREFQKTMLPQLWVKVGIDNLFDVPMPDITFFVGEQGEKVVYGMNSAIAAYARNGCNVIVDYIAYKQTWMKDLEEKLADIKTYYVAVDIPLEVLEQREEARGTSPKGHARSHYVTVYGDKKYDLRVNSGEHSANEIAQEIRTLILRQTQDERIRK